MRCSAINATTLYSLLRPLTQEEIAARREQARKRHAEMMANNAGLENGTLNLEPAAGKENKENESTEVLKLPEDEETPKSHVLAFARVYSGTIKKGQRLYVLGPKHDPREGLDKQLVPLEDQGQSDASRYRVSRCIGCFFFNFMQLILTSSLVLGNVKSTNKSRLALLALAIESEEIFRFAYLKIGQFL